MVEQGLGVVELVEGVASAPASEDDLAGAAAGLEPEDAVVPGVGDVEAPAVVEQGAFA